MVDTKLQDQMRRIVADFNAGRHDQARLLCEEGLRRTPDEPALNHLLAAVLFAKGEVAEARAHIRASLSIRADNASAHVLAGRIARAAKDFEPALHHFARAAELAPGVAVLIEGARTLDEAGDRSQAYQAWQAVARADPSSAEAAARLGRILFEDGMPAEAAPLLERAVKGDAPASAWFDLALVRQDLHEHAAAAAAYRKALEKRPDDAEAAVNLGVALQETGDMDAAIQAYRTAYQQRPTTFGIIAMALTSAPHGRLWLDRDALKGLLGEPGKV